MNKTLIYFAKKPILVVIILAILFTAILDLVFNMESSFWRYGISASLAVFLSPSRKLIKTQNGTKNKSLGFF